MSYGGKLHIPPTNSLLLTAKQKPYKEAYLLTKNIEEFSGKSLEERSSRQKKIREKGNRTSGRTRVLDLNMFYLTRRVTRSVIERTDLCKRC